MDSCDSLCFMVANSQEEDSQVIDDPIKMLHKLPALNQSSTQKSQKEKIQQAGARSSPRKHESASGIRRRAGIRKVQGSSGEETGQEDHRPPADQPAGGAAGGAGGGQGDEGGPGDNNGSQSDGAGGGAGGDGGDGGDGDDHGNEDQSDSDDHEEEATEETPPSSGNSTGQVPPLVRPSPSTMTPPSQIPTHCASHQHRQDEQSDTSAHSDAPSARVDPQPSTSHQEHSVSESEGGGISEASTAVVSDTEGHGQIIQRRSDLQPSVWQSPGCSHMSASPRRGEVSSALSTLSSLTSSSSSGGLSQGTPRIPKKRQIKRKPHADTKRKKLDTSSSTDTKTSSSDTSRTTFNDTSRTTSNDTTTSADRSHEGDTSGDKSHDTSGDQPHEPGDEPSSSQRDMFGDDQDANKKQERPVEEDVLVATPAEHIGSMQFSGEGPSIQTDEQIHTLGYVPASQETFGSVPYLIASSPTTGISEDEYGSERFRAEVGGVRKINPRKKTSQEKCNEDRQRMPPPPEHSPLQEDYPKSDQQTKSDVSDAAGNETGDSSNSKVKSRPSSTTSSSMRTASQSVEEWQPLPSLSLPETSQSLKEDPGSLKDDEGHVEVIRLKTESQAWGLEFSATEQHSEQQFELAKNEEYKPSSQHSLEKKPHKTCDSQQTPERHSGKATQATQQKGDIKEESIYGGRVVGELVLVPEPLHGLLEGDGVLEDADQDLEVAGVDQDDMDTSQGLALHLSPSQATQSQFSCGISSILKKLGSTQDAADIPEDVLPDLPEKIGGTSLAVTSQKMSTQGSQSTSSTVLHPRLTRSSKSQPSSQSQIGVAGFHLSIPGEGILLRPADMEDPSAAVASYLQEEEEAEKRAAELSQQQDSNTDGLTDTHNRLPTKAPAPSLTLDMIETQEELTEPSLSLFKHDQPTVQDQPLSDESQSMGSSVFRRAREAREKQRLTKESESQRGGEDPFEYGISHAIEREQSSVKTPDQKRKPKHSRKMSKKVSETVVVVAAAAAAEPEPMESVSETLDPNPVDITKIYEAETQDDEVMLLSQDVVEIRPQATLDGEDLTSDGSYTNLRETEEQADKEPNKEMVATEVFPSSPEEEDLMSSGVAPLREAAGKTARGKKGKTSKTDKKARSAQVAPKPKTSDVAGQSVPEEDPIPPSRDIRSLPLRSQGEKKTKQTPQAKRDTPSKQHAQRGQDPFEYRMSQSQHDRQSLEEVLELPLRTRKKGIQSQPQAELQQESGPVKARGAETLSEQRLQSLPDRLDSPVTRRKATPRKKTRRPATKVAVQAPSDISPPTGMEKTEETKQADRSVSVTTSLTPTSQESERRTFRLTRIKTVFSRTITILEERIGTVTVSSTVQNEKMETISQSVEHDEDSMSVPSPSRTAQTMTSGDLGDISSMSKSTSSKGGAGSTLASPHDFGTVSGLLSKTSSTTNLHHGLVSTTADDAAKAGNDYVSTAVQTSQSRKSPSVAHKALSPDPGQSATLFTASTQLIDSDKQPSKKKSISSEGSFIKPADLDSPDKSYKRKSKSTSTSSLYQSASLFGTSSESLAEKPGTLKKKSSSSASLQQSASLFNSSTSPEQCLPVSTHKPATLHSTSIGKEAATSVHPQSGHCSPPRIQEKKDKFHWPDPPHTPRMVSSQRTAVGQSQGSEVSESLIPATPQTDPGPRARGRRYRGKLVTVKGRTPQTRTPRSTREEDEETRPRTGKGIVRGRGKGKTSGRIQRQHTDSPDREASTELRLRGSGISHTAPILGTPDATSKAFFETGASVFALWKDRFFYPGSVVVYENQGRYTITFADGDIRQVRESDMVLCDDVQVGYQVMAERDELGGWSEVAGIIAIEDMMYEVQFQDGVTRRVPLKNLSLKSEQVKFMRKLFTPTSPEDAEPKEVAEVNPKPSTPQKITYEQLQPRDKAVYAMCNDRFFYPGYLVTKEGDNKFTIAFEDGDVRPARESDILHCDLLEAGQAIFAERKEWNEPAIIVEVFDEPAGNWGYVVQFEDGVKKRVKRGKVILSYEQATALKAANSLSAFSPGIKVADVSLDNLMPGKRRRPTSQQSTTMVTSPTANTFETPTSFAPASGRARGSASTNLDHRLTHSTGGKKKRKFSEIEPKATSTPTPKHIRTVQVQDAGDAPSPLPNVSSSPQGHKRSPRKAKQALFLKIKGPVPSRGSKIFQGLGFLLTHVEQTQEQKDWVRKLRRGAGPHDTTSDESTAEEEEVPFDKQHLEAQIKAGGGVVLERLDVKQRKQVRRCFCASTSFQRTLKYFQCLAASITCVSHVWIRDSCQMGVLQDYTAYILPAGISIEQTSIMEIKTQGSALHGMTAVVATNNSRFQEAWSHILELTGCRVTNRLPEDPIEIDVVVTDKEIPWDVLQRALESDVAVVSSEWVIQCLITGKRVPYDSHPKYGHDYLEPSV